MKVKNSLSIKLSPAVKVLFPLLCAAAFVVRFLQVRTVIDAATGFYKEDSVLTVIVYALLLGGSCLFILLGFFSREAGELQTLPYRSRPMFWMSLLLALALLFNAVASAGDFASAASGTAIGLRNLKEMMSSGALPLLIQLIFALLSSVYFLLVAVSYRKGSLLAAKHRVLALAPTAWVAARLLHLFVRKISFVKVSDLFFELLACAFMILFFLAFAQVTSGVYSTGMSWRLFGFGLPAALLTLSIQLPRLCFTFIDGGAFLNANHPFLAADLFLGLFAFTLCCVTLRLPDDAEPETAVAPAEDALSALDQISPIQTTDE